MAMVSLSSLLIWPPTKGTSTDIIICGASSFHFSPFLTRTGCASSNFLGPIRRHIWHSNSFKDYVDTNLRANFQSNSRTSSLTPQKSNDSHVTCKVLCRVIWSIEADLPSGYRIFLTGDPVSLGSWDPDLAIPFSPSLQDSNLFEAELTVPYGTNFKYNYFIRQSSSVIEWRAGPECSLSIPVFTGEEQSISVRDSWMRNVIHKLPFPSWGSWLFNPNPTIFKSNSHPSLSLGEHEISTSQNGAPSKIKIDDEDRIEIRANKINKTYYSPGKDDPVEEPWLLNSIILDQFSYIEDAEEEEEEKDEEEKDKEESIYERERENEEEKERVILVNSLSCSMQRIAVLEEGKLVELLLEPVKNKVQCDDIYLCVIAKMYPHMSGAFVDIGTERNAFLEITRYKKPFVFGTGESEEEAVYEEAVYEEERETIKEEFGEDVEELDAEVAHPIHNSIRAMLKKSNSYKNKDQWAKVKRGTKILAQVVKEGLGTKSPNLTPYPILRSRFWVIRARGHIIGVSSKIIGSERTRLKTIAQMLHRPGFSMTVRTVAKGHSLEELRKDLDGLFSTWKQILEHAKSAELAAKEGVEGAVPVLLHQAMGHTLAVVQDYFNDKVKRMVVDSPSTHQEIIRYLQEMAPELCERVELYEKKLPIFDEFNVEEQINPILSKMVPLPNGGSLVIEQTEALVSIDVNSGKSVFSEGTSQERFALNVNLEAVKQIARELRLRDIGGIIVVDFIDMVNESYKRLVYNEMSRAVKEDRSVNVFEISNLGLMELSRKRVRPSVSFMISDPCTCCQGTGRVEALEMSILKIENEIRRLIAKSKKKPVVEDPKTWPKFELRVDDHMRNYLTSNNSAKLAVLSVSINVRFQLKLALGLPRGSFELLPLNEDEARKDDQTLFSLVSENLETGLISRKNKNLPT